MSLIRQIPNLFTSFNLAIGVLGIINVFVGDFTNTIFFILLAGFFDFLDGFFARLFNTDGRFGKELDSLADMVSFGVLPSIYLYHWSSSNGNPDWINYAAILIAVFSGIRLAIFNLDNNQSEKFLGLPTPANAIMISTIGQLNLQINSDVFILGLVTFSCYMLIAKMEMVALKFKSFSFRENLLRYVLLAVILLLFVFLGLKALPYIIPIYIFLCLVSNITSKT